MAHARGRWASPGLQPTPRRGLSLAANEHASMLRGRQASVFWRRQVAGAVPNDFLNARENAASDS